MIDQQKQEEIREQKIWARYPRFLNKTDGNKEIAAQLTVAAEIVDLGIDTSRFRDDFRRIGEAAINRIGK